MRVNNLRPLPMTLAAGLLLAGWLTGDCATMPVKPTPPVPQVGLGITVTPHVRGVHFSVGAVSCDSLEDGTAYCAPVPITAKTLRIDPPADFYGVEDLALELHEGNNEIVVGLHLKLPPNALAAERGFLHVCGTDLCDEDGKPHLSAPAKKEPQ